MQEHHKYSRILTLVIILILLFFIVRYGYNAMGGNAKAVRFSNGVCDLKGKMEPHQFYGIAGDAEFYWNKLLTPNDLKGSHQQKNGYLKIPGTWSGKMVNGRHIDRNGYATLRFWLNLDRHKLYGLKIVDFDCAYKIWIDGKLKIECGKVGTSEQEVQTLWKRLEVYFSTQNTSTEVVIQVANFQHWTGGPVGAIILGKAIDVVDQKQKVVGFNFFILGVFLIMVFYHLEIYFYRKKDKSSLIFSILCGIIIVYLLTNEEKLIYSFFPQLDWRIAVRLEYLSYISIGPFFLLFTKQLYPALTSRVILRVCYGLAILFSAIVLFLPHTYFSNTTIAYQFILLFEGLYIFYILANALCKRLENSVVLFGGYFFLLVILINELLFYNELTSTSYLAPLGFLILELSHAFVLSRKASAAFLEVEVLSDRLMQYNKELEDVVEERTQAISFQKQEIEEQAKELMQVNEQLVKVDRLKNALNAMIVHDLKNPLNMVLNYSNDARITSAGHQMLSLVQNILDIQKYEHDKMMLNKHRAAIGTVVEKSLASVTYYAAQHNISIINRIPGHIELNIDAEVVERIFINLLTNALKYTPMNSEVDVEFKPLEGEKALFSITDRGPGIPMDKQQLIFEKYGSYNEQMLGRVKPTGLGLAFCKMAVEAHGGTIGFESELGKGTQMWFTLPLCPKRMELKESESFIVEESYPLTSYTLPTFHSDKEKIAFQKVVSTLMEIEVYKASRIRKVLGNEMPKGNPSIEEWVDTLLSSVWTGNDVRYRQQLKASVQLFTLQEL